MEECHCARDYFLFRSDFWFAPGVSWRSRHDFRRRARNVHNPQHRPVIGARVQRKSCTSDFSMRTQSDQNGEFPFLSAPIDDDDVAVTAPESEKSVQEITVVPDSSPIPHFMLDNFETHSRNFLNHNNIGTKLFAGPHRRRFFGRQAVRQENFPCAERAECGRQSSLNRRRPHVRRILLRQSARGLGGISRPVSLLVHGTSARVKIASGGKAW